MEEVLTKTLNYTPDAEVIHQQLISTQVMFENNKLKGVNTKQINGLGLRVIKDGKIGFSSTTDLVNLTQLVDNAIISAKFGQEAKFEFPKTLSPSPVKVFDEGVERFSIEEGVDLGKNLIDRLLALDSELFCKEAEISRTILKTKIVNTAGVDFEYQKTLFTIYVTGLLIRNNSLLWLTEYETGCDLNEACLVKDIEVMVSKIAESLAWSKNELSCKTKKLPMIFTPKLISTILDTVELGVNGKLIQKGASPLTNRLGEKIFDERLTIYDDATIDFAPNSCPVDGEGVRTQKTPLIENGVLKNYLFDLQTAGFLNTVSTGNGHRDFDSLPSPLCSNIVVLPGEEACLVMDFYDMIKDMKEGIIIDSVLGGGQSNVLAGEFAFNVELGFKVENGEVVGRLKDTMASGNVFDIFNRIRAIGSESYSWGNVISPHFYFDEINVVGNGKW
ncbi:MAG: TldD/PmbA family protein [Nitrospirota bacterium]